MAANDVRVEAIDGSVKAIGGLVKAIVWLMNEMVVAVYETDELVALNAMLVGAIAGWGRLTGELDDERGERVEMFRGEVEVFGARVGGMVARENVTRETVKAAVGVGKEICIRGSAFSAEVGEDRIDEENLWSRRPLLLSRGYRAIDSLPGGGTSVGLRMKFHPYVHLHLFDPLSPLGDDVLAVFSVGGVVCYPRSELGCPWAGLDHRRGLWQCAHRGDHRPAVSWTRRRSVVPLRKSHGRAAIVGWSRAVSGPLLRDSGKWRDGEKSLPRPHALLHADSRLGQYHRVF